jgi:CubicO group peptidase (beta-lactamase class C family)
LWRGAISRLLQTLTVSLVLLPLAVVGCIGDEDIKAQFEGYAPAALDDGWVVSTPDSEGLDVAAIDRVYERLFSQDEWPTAHALLIVRHGRLVAEAYARDDAERDRYHHLQSATKSITSMMLGMAIDYGYVESVDGPLSLYLPENFDGGGPVSDLTIYHALTMQTGFDFDNDVHTATLFNYDGDTVGYVLDRAFVFDPGQGFYYNDGAPQLVSAIVQRASGVSQEKFARERLFAPLGIDNYQWESSADGRTFGAFGLWLTPRDMAKIGQLMLQDGVWNGERLLSSDWIAESTTRHVNRESYGYYWWVYEDRDIFAAEGHGLQIIHIGRGRDLVVVLIADPYSSDAALSPGMSGLIGDVALAAR